ncbi:MAG TPA: nucleotidyl transferase AbiEii/AbiGii toxin family protein [Steroidobacteraceae bacterium]
MSSFSPRLDVLPEAQRRLWEELSAVPKEFVLYGGTALALHLGHRKSVDFDFFGSRAIDVPSLETEIPFLAGARIIQREMNTLSAIVDRGASVKVSFFGVPKLPRLAPPLAAKDNDLKVASLLDLAGTKASVLQVRAEAKDYIDMDALIRIGGVSLPFALAAAEKLYGSSFNPEITLKALSYFDDGNLRELPTDMKLRLAEAVTKVDVDHLPNVQDFKPRTARDRGLGL